MNGLTYTCYFVLCVPANTASPECFTSTATSTATAKDYFGESDPTAKPSRRVLEAAVTPGAGH